jgi:hypothetical protein
MDDETLKLRAAVQAALDFYEWHMNAVPSEVLDELVDRRAALQAQLKAALCTKPAQTERRYHQGEIQGFCAGCELWVFERDIYACPLGKRDLAVEARADKEARRGGRPKKQD